MCSGLLSFKVFARRDDFCRAFFLLHSPRGRRGERTEENGASSPRPSIVLRYVISVESAAALGCTGRRGADRETSAGNLSINRRRPENVFGEGAQRNTRGRVCSPFRFNTKQICMEERESCLIAAPLHGVSMANVIVMKTATAMHGNSGQPWLGWAKARRKPTSLSLPRRVSHGRQPGTDRQSR